MRRSCSPLFVVGLATLIACGDDPAPADTVGVDSADVPDTNDTNDTKNPDDEVDDPDDEVDTRPDADDDATEVATTDQDGDGLTDAEEAALGTDPSLVDSDADGYWDGWEVSTASDPKDPLSTPTLTVPEGDAYILDLVDIIEPSLLRTFLGSILDRWPPILLFIEGTGDAVRLEGGIAERTSLGPDDIAGTTDDAFSLELGSLDPATGQFQVAFDGARTGDDLAAASPEVIIDLSGISEIVRGVRLRVEDVTFTTTYVDGGQRLAPTRLAGILSRAGVEDILLNADLPLPIDTDTAMQLLDPDGDGIIAVDIALEGRPAIASGWITTPDVEPVARDPGVCCPPGLAVGDPIDSALAIVDQGLQPSEEALGAQVIDEALSQPELLDFIATQRIVDGERRTYVYSPRGHIYFVRQRAAGTTTYVTYALASQSDLEGELIANDDARNPLANQDPSALSSYEAFLAASEPFAANADYASRGYTQDDERLARVPLGEHPYPFGYERLAQIFDDPRAGDFVLMEASYVGNRGSHGHLSALQSRSALIVSGAGVVYDAAGEGWATRCVGDCTDATTPYLVRDAPARIVDVAPTIAKALGVAPTTGVAAGFVADDVYLAWQDGQPLDAALSGTTAKYAIIVVNDGLTSMELLHQAFDPARDLDAYRELMSRGVTYLHGAITNYPSNTYPSHNVIGSGAYSGHHGIVDNSFFERPVATGFAPISELFGTEKFLGSAHAGLPVETLHEAVLRSFGGVWHKTTNPSGVITASLNDPSTRGAPLATLERRVPDGYEVPEPYDALALSGVTYTYPEATLLDAEGLLDNSTVTNAYGLFILNPAEGFPIPKYSIINLSSTDGAGHAAGPHGDELREHVLAKTNMRLRMLIEILKAAGIYDDTIIVLTADHGMELKDPNVPGRLLSGLGSDITVVRESDFIYLKQLAVTRANQTLTVSDTDHGAPVGGALVAVMKDGVEIDRGTTAVDGTVTLTLGDADTLVVSKTGFSTESHPLD